MPTDLDLELWVARTLVEGLDYEALSDAEGIVAKFARATRLRVTISDGLDTCPKCGREGLRVIELCERDGTPHDVISDCRGCDYIASFVYRVDK